MKKTKPQNAVERLVGSLERRIKCYEDNLGWIEDDYQERKGRELRKIADAKLQLKALKRK